MPRRSLKAPAAPKGSLREGDCALATGARTFCIDAALLKGLAQATGGEYYEPANFGDLVQRLRSRTITEDIHRELGLQTVPGLFAVLFAVFLSLVTAEWLLRKHYQLN